MNNDLNLNISFYLLYSFFKRFSQNLLTQKEMGLDTTKEDANTLRALENQYYVLNYCLGENVDAIYKPSNVLN